LVTTTPGSELDRRVERSELRQNPVVEVRGFEPLASSMRPKRSSQLSYTPAGTVTIAEGSDLPTT
jgi:hypothetical protein